MLDPESEVASAGEAGSNAPIENIGKNDRAPEIAERLSTVGRIGTVDSDSLSWLAEERYGLRCSGVLAVK